MQHATVQSGVSEKASGWAKSIPARVSGRRGLKHDPATGAGLRTEAELAQMRTAGALVAKCLEKARAACRPGVTTLELDAIVRETIGAGGGKVLFEGYRQGASPPFPGACCVSVNDEVVHGIPGERVIEAGDLVTIDVGIRMGGDEGWCADSATTLLVDSPEGADSERARLLQTTERALARAIDMMSPGVRWSSIAMEIQRIADEAGFGVVEEYVGHGVGKALHEPPRAPACHPFDHLGTIADFELREGMTLAVEPILTLASPARTGRTAVRVRDDGWTVVTQDESVACHAEHTVAVTGSGAIVLTAA